MLPEISRFLPWYNDVEGTCAYMKSVISVDALRDVLLAWFGANRRDLPWRGTYDPYQVWISEIMLQQTQMERGVACFLRWLERFPDVEAVAGAPEREILKAWEGLGYYARARNIGRAARILMDKHGGRVPDNHAALLVLPGIGPYTAAAIMSIAFNRPVPVVDANVERLFARLGDIDRPMKERQVRRDLEEYLRELVSLDSPRDLNQALMELGALVCTPRNPDCGSCPLVASCLARRNNTTFMRPVVPPRPGRIEIEMACTIIVREGTYFIQQRRDDDVWGGLWEFPGGSLKEGETPEAAAVRELREETGMRGHNPRHLATVTHHYTRYRVILHGFFCEVDPEARPVLHAARCCAWVTLAELDDYAFPSGHRQLISKIMNSCHG